VKGERERAKRAERSHSRFLGGNVQRRFILVRSRPSKKEAVSGTFGGKGRPKGTDVYLEGMHGEDCSVEEVKEKIFGKPA